MSSWEQADELWQEGVRRSEERGEATRLPDGHCQARVAIARIEVPSWNEDIEQLFVYWVGVSKEGTMPQWLSLDPEDEIGIQITAGVCRALGYEEDTPRNLRAYVEAGRMLDRIHEVNVKTKPGEKRDFTTVYVNRYLGQWDGSRETAPVDDSGYVPPADDDDIPF